jgi:hypothetical protein
MVAIVIELFGFNHPTFREILQIMAKSQKSNPIATFFIGGAGDKKGFWGVGPISNLTRKTLVRRYFYELGATPLIGAEINQTAEEAYYGYDETEQLFIAIRNIHKRHPSVKIRLIGHSLGGWKAAKLTEKLAKESIPTALLITIDPVGTVYFKSMAALLGRRGLVDITRPRPKAAVWVNLLANHTIQYDHNDLIADAGMRWRPHRDGGLKHKPHTDHHTPYSHAEVMEMMTFSGKAGNAAWALLMEGV